MYEQNINKLMKVGLAVLTLLALFLTAQTLGAFKALGDNEIGYNSITVTGESEVTVVPDIATFTFSVTEGSETVATAQSMATAKINKALDALKAQGVEEKDLKTDSYNIYPKYEWVQPACYGGSCPNGTNVLIGYEVSQSVTVKVRDTAKAGDLLTLVGAQGISNVSGLSFTIDDIDSIKEKARTEAIADAKAQAKKLAKELRIDLGDVVGFYEEVPGGYYPMYDSMAMGSAKAEMSAPQLPVGENKVTVRVNVTYKID